jgi:hypothetical protein
VMNKNKKVVVKGKNKMKPAERPCLPAFTG